jgi:hypothetical protein
MGAISVPTLTLGNFYGRIRGMASIGGGFLPIPYLKKGKAMRIGTDFAEDRRDEKHGGIKSNFL